MNSKLSEVIVRDFDGAVGYEPYVFIHKFAVISIVSLDVKLPNVWKPKGIAHLDVRADDIDPVRHPDNDLYLPLNAKQARDIAEFALEQRFHVEELLIHCSAGYGRSTGCALAIWDVLGLRACELPKGAFPNRHVFDLVRDALRNALRPGDVETTNK
jgi:predicted protein tyrosine phosphatase